MLKNIVRILIAVLVLLLIFRLGARLFYLLMRLWYITLPVLLVLWFYARQRLREQSKRQRRDNLDPDKEVIVDQDKKN